MSCLGGNIARLQQLHTLKHESITTRNGAQSMTNKEKVYINCWLRNHSS